MIFGELVSKPTACHQDVANYPDINSLMNNLRLTGTYDVRPNVQLVLQGIFTSFHNNDWDDTSNAIHGAGTSIVSILTPGYNSPSYTVEARRQGALLTPPPAARSRWVSPPRTGRTAPAEDRRLPSATM